VDCALAVIRDPRKAILLISKGELEEGDYVLKLRNVPWEDIHLLPMDDQYFFKPSFDLLVQPEQPAITFHWMEIKFTNEKGLDGGGPRRNWLDKMMYAWTDPRRHFLKTHDKYLVPDVYLNYQVMYGLGRLLGKVFAQEVGLPFAFHPDFIDLLRAQDSVEVLERCFSTWYADEMKTLKQILEMAQAAEDMEDIDDLALVAVEHWSLTDDTCGYTVGMTAMDAIQRGCSVPIEHDVQAGAYKTRTLDQYVAMEGASKLQGKPRSVQAQALASHIHPTFFFKPTCVQDVERFTEEAREHAMSHFKAGLEAFLRGLDVFVEARLFVQLRREVLLQILSPTIAIDLESLSAAFMYENAEGLSVAVRNTEGIPKTSLLKTSRSQPKGQARMSVIDAFKYALTQLSMEELHGFVGQMTGSRVTGLGGFKPNQFTARFSRTLVARSLIKPEGDVKCPVPEPKLPERRKGSQEQDEPTITPNVELPFTASWYEVYLLHA